MHGPNGADYPNEIVFVEIDSPRRLVLHHVSAPRFLVTVDFDDLGGKTKVCFRQLFESPDVFERIKSLAVPANEQNFDKLAVELVAMGGRSELVLSRFLAAPRELVWKVWTDPRHLARWWGPRGFTNPRCELELRPGGAIHIDMQASDGTVYPMNGRFVEIAPPERLVFTACPLDRNGKPIFEGVNAVAFHAVESGTRVEVRATVENLADPIGLRYLSGREQGWSESFYRLADALEEAAGHPVSTHR
jgi:uncharacterized protein YndB with AHSA1/START domain